LSVFLPLLLTEKGNVFLFVCRKREKSFTAPSPRILFGSIE